MLKINHTMVSQHFHYSYVLIRNPAFVLVVTRTWSPSPFYALVLIWCFSFSRYVVQAWESHWWTWRWHVAVDSKTSSVLKALICLQSYILCSSNSSRSVHCNYCACQKHPCPFTGLVRKITKYALLWLPTLCLRWNAAPQLWTPTVFVSSICIVVIYVLSTAYAWLCLYGRWSFCYAFYERGVVVYVKLVLPIMCDEHLCGPCLFICSASTSSQG